MQPRPQASMVVTARATGSRHTQLVTVADMPGQFDGKVALVTGGARGIGRAICESLARDGADVAINFRGQVDAAEEVAAYVHEHGGRAITVQADMGDPDAV